MTILKSVDTTIPSRIRAPLPHLVLGVGLAIALLVASSCSSPAPSGRSANGPYPHYGAIVDAGSSGSRLFVYQWWEDETGLPRVRTLAKRVGEDCTEAGFSEDSCRLDTLADRPDCSCLQCLARETRALPELEHLQRWKIDLWVEATGGVRRLDDPAQQRALEQTRTCLEDARGYTLREVEVLPGKLEAAYAWLAVNDLRGALRYPEAQVGIVEVGGESAQTAFGLPMAGVPSPPTPAAWQIVELELGPLTLPVYAVSRLEGQDGVYDRIEEPASGLRGSCSAASQPADCQGAIAKVLGVGPRPDATPETPEPRDFVGISAPAYTTENFGLPLGEATLADLGAKAERLCGQTGGGAAASELSEILDGIDAKYRDEACFSALYSPFVTRSRFGIDPRRVLPLKRIAGEEPSWTRGAMLVEAGRLLSRN